MTLFRWLTVINDRDLCNYYCSHKCEIGYRYVPEIEMSELSSIILETIASLDEINPLTGRLIQIGPRREDHR